MIKQCLRAFLALGLVIAIAVALGAQNPNAADHDFTSVKTLPAPGVTVGNAQLVRNDNGITCIIHTSGLVPGDVYSVWWVIPTEALIFNATGAIAASDGTATFAGHASTGPIGPVDESVVLSNGDGSFDSPRTDTIMVIVRHHGPPIPGIINQQMGTFNTGCGAGGCKNVQAATFLP
jgi:hypothetical protein